MQNENAAFDTLLNGGVNSAMAGKRLRQELKIMNETAKLVREQKYKTNWEAGKAKAEANIAMNNSRIADIILEHDKNLYGGQMGEIIRGMQLVPGSASVAGGLAGLTAFGLKKLLTKAPKGTVTDKIRHGPNLTRTIKKELK